ncbi:MAG: 6-bladed beta-propeller [bacterium]
MRHKSIILSLITWLIYSPLAYAEHGGHDKAAHLAEKTEKHEKHEKAEKVKEPEFWKADAHQKPEQSHHNGYDSLKENAQDYFNQGINLHNNLQFIEAIPFYKKAIELNPSMLNAWYWMGKSYYRAGLVEQAFSAWRYAITLGEIDENEEISKRIKAYYLKEDKLPTSYESLASLQGNTPKNVCFNNPTGIASDHDGFVYLANYSGRILKLSPTFNLISQIGIKGKGEQNLWQPYGICVDKSYNIWVTDKALHKVIKFSPQGRFLLSIGHQGYKTAEFSSPEAVAADSKGNIFVADAGNSRVQKFNKDGKFIACIGRLGHGNGGLYHPRAVLVDKEGYVWVADSWKKSLFKFDEVGEIKEIIPIPGNQKPLALTIGNTDNNEISYFYLTTAEGNVFRFFPANNEWTRVEIKGKTERNSLYGIAVNHYGYLYLTDFNTNSVESCIPSLSKQLDINVEIEKVDISRFPLVTHQVSVTTRDKTPLVGLKGCNFKVGEDKLVMKPVGIKQIIKDTDHISISFVVDNCINMHPFKQRLKKMFALFSEKMKSGIDEISVCSVNKKESHEILPFTFSKTRIEKITNDLSLEEEHSDEAVYHGIIDCIDSTLKKNVRKAIVVVTSGQGGEITSLYNRCKYFAKNNSIPIFIVDTRTKGESVLLKEMALDTGGKYYILNDYFQGKRIKYDIDQQTHRQVKYLLTYKAEACNYKWDNSWVRTVIIARYKDMTGRDMNGYFIPDGKGSDGEYFKMRAEKYSEWKDKEAAEKLEARQVWEERLMKQESGEAAKEKEAASKEKEAKKPAPKKAGGGGHGGGAKKHGGGH